MNEQHKQWIDIVDRIAQVADVLETAPELQPLARRMLASSLGLNGDSLGSRVGSTTTPKDPKPTRRNPFMAAAPDTRKTGRKMSVAQRKRLSIAAKKRWSEAKRNGKNTLGGGA